jgi:hypothetical protein
MLTFGATDYQKNSFTCTLSLLISPQLDRNSMSTSKPNHRDYSLRMIELSGEKPAEFHSNVPVDFENEVRNNIFILAGALFFKSNIILVLCCKLQFFSGKMLVVIPITATCDSDCKSPHLFEVRVQGTFKKKPHTMFMGGILQAPPLHLGMFLGAAIRVCVAFAKSKLRGLHFGLGSSTSSSPHMLFPLYRAMDRIICSKL